MQHRVLLWKCLLPVAGAPCQPFRYPRDWKRSAAGLGAGRKSLSAIEKTDVENQCDPRNAEPRKKKRE